MTGASLNPQPPKHCTCTAEQDIGSYDMAIEAYISVKRGPYIP